MAPSIAVLGSYNTDLIVSLKRLPRPGETILGGRFQTAAGGKGANQAVAAGDTFNGALAVALTEGQPLAKAVQFANAAAAISVTRVGAQTSAPTRKAIDALLRRRQHPRR
jgi:sugar/nucleoside kinase (ribokinase family)